MDVINKFYSSVSSTVSQLSGVLPGNPVTREYEINNHIASAGPGLLWKIYSGYKKSTKQEAAIFVFEKRSLDRWSKTDRDVIIESLKRGVTQLTKLRHPQILTVQYPLEDSRESLAFATEPVLASLANLLGQADNMPRPTPPELSDYEFHEVEIKYGLLQIGEGLAFLHNDVKLLHKNISPESIIINKQGAWKIFGFDFCVHNESLANAPPNWPFIEYTSSIPPVAQPSHDYLSPEGGLTHSHSPASDMFALGMVACALHSPGRRPPRNDTSKSNRQPPPAKLHTVPEGLRDYVKSMLGVKPETRPDAHQFVKIPYFDDVGVKTLQYLDSLLQWDNVQRSQFYKGLPDALQKLPPRVRLQRVLPCLLRDLTQPIMVPFVLPSILNIAEYCTKEEYDECVLPFLKPVMKLQEPIEVLIVFLQRMELILKLTSPDDVKQDVLPMLYRGLDGDAQPIHELCLTVLPSFARQLDHAGVKNSVLPRIKRLCLSTRSLSVRVNCLLCLGRLLENLDKWLVLDEVLPFLPQIPSRQPPVLMGILGIYKLAMDHKKLGITKEVMATKILPFLMPLCIENDLTMKQFDALVALVKQMFSLVETEHRSKLQQLNAVRQERKQLESSTFISNNSITVKTNDSKLEDLFSGLGMDSFLSGSGSNTNVSSQPVSTSLTPTSTANTNNSFTLLEAQKPVTQPEPVKVPPPQSFLSATPIGGQKPIPLATDLTNTLTRQWTSPTSPPAAPVWPNNAFSSPNYNPNITGMSAFAMPNSQQWNAYTQPKPFANQVQNGNWSALDSLLPNVQQTKTTMNQMVTQKQPLKPNNPQQNGTNKTNALSKDEIMDLLS